MTPQDPHSDPVRRSRRLVIALTLVAAVATAPSEGPRIDVVSGAVEIGSGEPPTWRPATAGDALAPGDAIRTGHDGRAELALVTGMVRLYPNSLLRLPELGAGPDDAERVGLDRGRSLFDVLRRRNGRFEVETPEVVVSVKGTRFGVDLEGPLSQVAVYRGLVGVREVGTTLALETLVREGFGAVGGANHPFDLMLNGAPDPWDAWRSGQAVPFLENRIVPGAKRPSASDAIPPAKQAVDEARLAARDAARPEVLELAMERDPALRERALERAKLRRAVGRRTAEVRAERMERARERPELLAQRDAVADARDARLKQEIQSAMIETIVTGAPSAGGGSSGGGLPFAVQFLSGSGMSGGDLVEILAAGSSYTFDDDDVEDLIDGQATLPPLLLNLLVTNGVSTTQLQALYQQMQLLLETN